MQKIEVRHIFGSPETQISTDGILVELANLMPYETDIDKCIQQHSLVFWFSPQPIIGQGCLGDSPRLSALGNLGFIPADVTGHCRFRPEARLRRAIAVRYSLSMFNRLDEEASHRCDPWSMASCNLRHPGIQQGMQQIAKEAQAPGFASAIMVESIGTGLLVQLARHFGHHGHHGGDRAAGRGGLAPWQLRRITERIVDESAADLLPTLAELAMLVGISTSHLRHAFKQSTGCTIGTYIRNVQIDRARDLLSTTNLTLKEISMRLGFSTSYGFTLAFQRGVGVTPSAFRQQTRVGSVALSYKDRI